MEKRCLVLFALPLSVFLAFILLGADAAKVERFRRQVPGQNETANAAMAYNSTVTENSTMTNSTEMPNVTMNENSSLSITTQMLPNPTTGNYTAPNNLTQNGVNSTVAATYANPLNETLAPTSNPYSTQASVTTAPVNGPVNNSPSSPATATNQPETTTATQGMSSAASSNQNPTTLPSGVTNNAVSSSAVSNAAAVASSTVAAVTVTAPTQTAATATTPTAATASAAVGAASTSMDSNPSSLAGQTTMAGASGSTSVSEIATTAAGEATSSAPEQTAATETTIEETEDPDNAVDPTTPAATSDLSTSETKTASSAAAKVTVAPKGGATAKRVVNNSPAKAADPKKMKCSTLNANQLQNCCDNPNLNFFTTKQKLSCNNQKNNPTLFASTVEYSLHKLQSQKHNMIDFSSDQALRSIGNSACFTECLFKDIRAFSNNLVNEALLVSHFARDQDDEWTALISDSTIDCIQHTSALQLKKIDKGNKRKFTKGCSLVPAVVMQCILKNVYEASPVTQNTNNTQCMKVKERFSICDPLVTKATDVAKRRINKQQKRGGLRNRKGGKRANKNGANNQARKSRNFALG